MAVEPTHRNKISNIGWIYSPLNAMIVFLAREGVLNYNQYAYT